MLLARVLALVQAVVAEHAIGEVGEVLGGQVQLHATDVAEVRAACVAAGYGAAGHVVAAAGPGAWGVAHWALSPAFAGHELLKSLVRCVVLLPPLPVGCTAGAFMPFLALVAHLLLARGAGDEAFVLHSFHDDHLAARARALALVGAVRSVELRAGLKEAAPEVAALHHPAHLMLVHRAGARGHGTMQLLLGHALLPNLHLQKVAEAVAAEHVVAVQAHALG